MKMKKCPTLVGEAQGNFNENAKQHLKDSQLPINKQIINKNNIIDFISLVAEITGVDSIDLTLSVIDQIVAERRFK